ncbi:MAG: chemotaxis protein CheW [Ekhidna sp.]
MEQIDNVNAEKSEVNYEVDEEVSFSKAKLFCVFNIGGESYAIPMSLVKEVVKKPDSTSIPQMPDYFSEMTNIRGEVHGILDLTMFFQDSEKKQKANYLLIINDDEYRVAIALNEVPDTLKVEEDMVEELSTSALGSIRGKKYLSGIVRKEKQMIILFDVKGIISGEKFTQVS